MPIPRRPCARSSPTPRRSTDWRSARPPPTASYAAKGGFSAKTRHASALSARSPACARRSGLTARPRPASGANRPRSRASRVAQPRSSPARTGHGGPAPGCDLRAGARAGLGDRRPADQPRRGPDRRLASPFPTPATGALRPAGRRAGPWSRPRSRPLELEEVLGWTVRFGLGKGPWRAALPRQSSPHGGPPAWQGLRTAIG